MREPAGQGVRLLLLGCFEVQANGRTVIDRAWPRRKAQTLLKLLALQPGRSLHREQVYEYLWPDLDTESAANNLYQNLRHLRQAFAGRELATPLVSLSRDRVALSSDAAFDVDAFREAAERARAAGNDAKLYEEALALYAGDLLPDDLYEPWTEPDRRDLSELRKRLLLDLAAMYEGAGDFEQSIDRLQAALRSDPALEEAHRHLMRLFAALGQRDQALRQYQTCREQLRRDLDVGPSAETEALYREIISSADLPAASSPRTNEREPAPQRVKVRRLPRRAIAAVASVGAIAGLAVLALFLTGHLDPDTGSAAPPYQHIAFSHMGRTTGTLVGDCVNENIRAKGDYTGDVTGDITGTIAGGGEGEYYAATKCASGELLTTYTITDTAGNQLFITEDYRGPVETASASSGGKITVRANIPLANETITGGSGAYMGATGDGNCNLRTTGELAPGSTDFVAFWQSDCTLELATAPAATQSP